MISKSELEELANGILADLNSLVFPKVHQALLDHPALRMTLNPAFPFPQKIRVGVLDTHLVVEYVGPEDPKSDTLHAQAAWKPGQTLFEFLGLDLGHLKCSRIPYDGPLENVQIFLGDAMTLLGDYLYDVVSNPNDLMLNGIPDFSKAKRPTYLSNISFLWSDEVGTLRIRHFDFVEMFPIQQEGWSYHDKESLKHFAEFIINHQVPRYRLELHHVLNEFIQLVATPGTNETAITSFLSKHPEILQLSLGADDLNPQVNLVWQYATEKPNVQPDFMPVKMDGFADILDFKLPRLKGHPMVGTPTRRHPSAEVDTAIAQVDEYAEWCGQEANRRWLEKKKGVKVHEPYVYLVIGHSDDFTSKDRQKLRRRRNATIFTYDEFIAMARMQLYRVR